MSKEKNVAHAAAAATETAVATTDQATGAVTLKFVPKVIKKITQNLLKLRAGSLVYVKVRAPMELAKAIKRGKSDKAPPTLLPVINLETGEEQTIIAGAVLVDLLMDEYPDKSYVGKGFMIAVKEKKDSQEGGGRTYNTYDVAEIELPA